MYLHVFSEFYRRAAWIAYVELVEKNAFPCTFQYATGAHMNIHDTACMTAHPVFQINGNFTILVRMTFICTCSSCNSERAYICLDHLLIPSTFSFMAFFKFLLSTYLLQQGESTADVRTAQNATTVDNIRTVFGPTVARYLPKSFPSCQKSSVKVVTIISARFWRPVQSHTYLLLFEAWLKFWAQGTCIKGHANV